MKTAAKQSFSPRQQQSSAMSCCHNGTKFTQTKTNSNLVLLSSIINLPLISALILVAIILVNLIIL
jgi:hypothetical protein